MNVSTSLQELKRVGTVTASNLRRLDLQTVGDLLHYFPFRYEDLRTAVRIADLQVGQTVTVTGQLELIQNKRSPRRRMNITEALISDGTEMLRVIWFNQPFLTKSLRVGDHLSLAGRVTEDFGGLIMTSPVYEKITSQGPLHTQGIVPMYHLTSSISQKQLRSAIAQIVGLSDAVDDWVPKQILQKNVLEPLHSALRNIHFPKDAEALKLAKDRLGFNELFLLQLRAQKQRQEFLSLIAPIVSFKEEATKSFVQSLPFDLTTDQKKSAWEIIQDMGNTKPMLRLLQGDVGSGKTIVASLAAYNVALSKQQTAFMVPTEILAFQHFKTLSETIFKNADFTIALCTRTYQLIKLPGQEVEKLSKKEIVRIIASGEALIIIGTHSLIQEAVDFNNLAFVIIDEQHRFGVEQRGLLTAKVGAGKMPHLLSMTATPIPRSLALAMYGDLDISVIKQMPIGRKKIITKLSGETDRDSTYAFIANELSSGRQAFIVCPLIEPSDKLGVRSVTTEFKRLDQGVFKDFTVGLLHGRLKPDQREKVMQDFASGTIQLLIATSVIEIGVDIPNATVMMIEDADRFGLAQLHQYRGRVGRSVHQSYCFLMSESTDPKSQERLSALLNFDSGFDLARADLKFRGPGEVYGLEQKGFPELKMANFYDVELIKKARDAALELITDDSDLEKYPEVRKQLGDWEQRAHLE
jgi:ATP-dependent DNA helicase RecG